MDLVTRTTIPILSPLVPAVSWFGETVALFLRSRENCSAGTLVNCSTKPHVQSSYASACTAQEIRERREESMHSFMLVCYGIIADVI
jgi:hypothetical protein